MDFFKKVSLKDILADEDFLRPQQFKRRDLLKEENIVFHTSGNLGLEADSFPGGGSGELLDFERQRELELYRKRFEEALVRIEDKEDVIALQQAKREIDDEFDEEQQQQIQLQQTESTGRQSLVSGEG
jgi:hypothetical protein